jgi:hypothetical protein
VGLGLHQGLLQQEAIADRTASAPMAAPISGEELDPPAELMGGTADGLISTTGPAMQQQVNRSATAALEQGGGDALLGPDEITPTSGDDDDRAMGQHRRRREAKRSQCSGLGHCSGGQAHGLQSKRTGQAVRGFVIHSGASGDGLVAFGAAFILPVQTHYRTGGAAAGQWIYAKPGHPLAGPEADKQPRQIHPWMTNRPRSRAREPGTSPQPIDADEGSATAAAGELPYPPPYAPGPVWGWRRLADARHGAAVAR